MNLENLSPGTIVAVVLGIALLPYLAVMLTAFTKVVVVLSLLRSALGLQQAPPNVVLNGLAIILAAYVMYPVGLEMTDLARAEFDSGKAAPAPRFGGVAVTPLAPAKSTKAAASSGSGNGNSNSNASDLTRLAAVVDHAKTPLQNFLKQHASEPEREFFHDTARRLLPEARRDRIAADDLIVLVPAFTASELARAFRIGFLIFLPFLVIDLIVANVLQALGMMMLSPTTIALPFKLLLFVAVDGWSRLMHGLVLGYA
jgi:type III secretion protein R